MRAEDFVSTRAGTIVRTMHGYDAFVPHPLPPQLFVDWDLTRALSEAERALGKLDGIGATLQNPHLLIGPFMRKEAVLSSRIEGTEASLSDLFLFEAAGARPRDTSDVHEVANYLTALQAGLKRVHELPVSQRLLRELHAVLMRGVRGDEVTPGEFRTTQNWIGRAGARLDQATFVPPPVAEMHAALSALERFIHADQTFPFLVWLALIHYQFECIHPFRDGNGRIGRLLIVLLMMTNGVLRQPLLYVSAYLEKHRTEYYERLLGVSQRGELEQWVHFFLRAVEEQSHDAVARALELNALRDEYRRKLHSARASGLVLQTMDELFKAPAISIPQLAATLSVTYRSAQQIVTKLETAGIIEEATGRQRNRIYIAPGILHAIEA